METVWDDNSWERRSNERENGKVLLGQKSKPAEKGRRGFCLFSNGLIRKHPVRDSQPSNVPNQRNLE